MSRAGKTRCVRDTDGDGNCAGCARYGDEAPCRVPTDEGEGDGDMRTVSLPVQYGVTYDQVVELMERVAAEPYRDSWGRMPMDVEKAMRGGEYHKRPREYIQGRGMGLPYNTRMPSHFTARYGMRRESGLWVGVRADTPMECARFEARENGARRTLRILSF